MIGTLAAFSKATGFVVLTLTLMPVQWAFIQLRLQQAHTLPHHYHRWVCWLLGVKVLVEGEVATPGLIAANHVSWLDIPVLSSIRPLAFIAKKQVSRWPFFGTLARLQDTLFVDRESRQATGKSNELLIERLKQGQTLVLFPEGTSNNSRRLFPFKSSFFAGVEKTGLPLIPVNIIYQTQHGLPLTLRQRPEIAWYGDADLLPHLWGVLKRGPITVRVVFHAPLRPEGFANRKAMAHAVESLLRAHLATSLHQPPKIG